MFSWFCQLLKTIYEGLLKGSDAVDQSDQEGGRQVYPIHMKLRAASSISSVKKWVYNSPNPTTFRL